MALHRFAIGQSVHLKNGFNRSDAAGGVYRITAILPERNNSPQYRIRSDGERHERVTTEDTLELINLPSPIGFLFKGDFHG
ncbi:hypothetical protein C7441_11614 [Pseudaminobacter salicylatoxidans]|uniref:Uncharacterized protein n=1 Tax=Pseudaminobacter salicylatoxidans TaxID=93369 RepID=A0A316BVQ5_PSESE|nr:hypothetical protein [Pseudaminobacter salicylatoxidans]PWJ78349.1 hypothetical protein C7441_11614 [Pseudaminobacter salicylatoxidans]